MVDRDEDGWWVATVPSLPGCHTQGRSLSQVRSRIREAMNLFDVPAGAEVVLEVKGPERTSVARVRAERLRAEAAAQKANEATQRLASQLVKKGVSLRDIGDLVGLSFQRVQQLVGARPSRDEHVAKQA